MSSCKNSRMKPAEPNILWVAEVHLQASTQRQLAEVWACLAVSHYQRERSMSLPSSASFLPTWTNWTPPATTSCLKTHKEGLPRQKRGLFLEELSTNSSQGDFRRLMGKPTLLSHHPSHQFNPNAGWIATIVLQTGTTRGSAQL